MKVLITGSNGQLGKELQRIIQNNKSEIGNIDTFNITEMLAVDVDQLDITDAIQTRNLIIQEKPQIIFNCAAYTNVDACEENPDLAFQVNSYGAKNIAKSAQEIGAQLVHVSTDYVFSGDNQTGTPYREWDITEPQGIYGKSKKLGEEWVIQCCPTASVVRTAWLYGYEGNNFVKTILKAGQERGKLKVVNDQIGNPTNANDLAHHLLKLPFQGGGVYHCTNEGVCSWYDFACEIIKLSGIDCIIEPCTTEEFPRPAKRPAFSALDNMHLRNSVGNEMRSWQSAITSYISNLKG